MEESIAPEHCFFSSLVLRQLLIVIYSLILLFFLANDCSSLSFRPTSPLLLGPDKTKVKIINISARSAFSAFSALPSYPKMAVTSPATANQQLSHVEASQ